MSAPCLTHAAAALGAIGGWAFPQTRKQGRSAERILHPGSKLAAARGLAEETARDTLRKTLGLQAASEDDL